MPLSRRETRSGSSLEPDSGPMWGNPPGSAGACLRVGSQEGLSASWGIETDRGDPCDRPFNLPTSVPGRCRIWVDSEGRFW